MTTKTPKPEASPTPRPKLVGYTTEPSVIDRLRDDYGIDVPLRRFKGWVWAGRVSHLRVGNRTMFSDDNLRELVESMTVKAAR